MSHSQRQVRLVKLIRKLLELAKNNSNPNESGLALSRAQKLMQKYGISELDAESSSVREYQTQKAPSDAVKVPQWMDRLVWVVNRTFGCRAYYSWQLDSMGNSHRVVMFCGFGERPVVAAYAFDVLSRQLKEATAAYLKTQNKRLKLATRRARADQFREGWVEGVRRVVVDFGSSQRENQVMAHYLEALALNQTQLREAKKCRGADVALGAGFAAGKNARLYHGVDGAGQVRLTCHSEVPHE
ncbi:DUF2786 domain-containing protein [Serratia fonticola]|uniref:DUF2786 domain-containing protein n=1 Tax=Serratia fonticola TaxID=47917 RepID=A0AAW3WK49_SERFO|nr:DUF2786 domain-containing protein [Serratia fonticola]MBC3211074.1 DUF2786 domain-containing protein [Serratia fonticola]NYA12056.1 DUF2786 domain-containing protein [Serratia fonticola]NYA31635.1 DUF2786 domain-containing protein [Serratia fonticola]